MRNIRKIAVLVLALALVFVYGCSDVGRALAYSKTYKVAGVTFNNKNGTSRQQALADLMAVYGEGNSMPCRLVEYDYNGEPAFYVYVGTKIIGNIPADDVAEVKSLLQETKNTRVTIGKFKPDGETIYYARVIIDNNSKSSNENTHNTTHKVDDFNDSLLVIPAIFLLYVCAVVALGVYIKKHPKHSPRIRLIFVTMLWLLLHSLFVSLLKTLFNIKQMGFLPTFLIALLFWYFGKINYSAISDSAELAKSQES